MIPGRDEFPSRGLLVSSLFRGGDYGERVTRRCITALRRHTRQPWELIVVDDGSTDETSVYLASVRDAAAILGTVIAGAAIRGIQAAINQGLGAARGEYLVVLNNDVVVTDGWLGQLIALANAKGDFTAEHAEHAQTQTAGEREGRPAFDLGAGSRDPRIARGPIDECPSFESYQSRATP
jgi:glycosyltransferase involved in cell wall biosynthesis